MLNSHPLAGLWLSGLLFVLSHSLLATDKAKAFAYRSGFSVAGYRLGYVCLSIVLTVIWVLYLHGLDDTVLYVVKNPARWISYLFQAAAVWLFILSVQPIDTGVFLGLKKFPGNKDPFIEAGIYKYMRHPMYVAVMLFMFFSPNQSVNSLNLYFLMSVYFVIGARFEERRLLKVHPEYAEYKKRVPAFIPHFNR